MCRKYSRFFFVHRKHIARVYFWYKKRVSGVYWFDIKERQHSIVFVDDFCGKLFFDDFTKDAVVHTPRSIAVLELLVNIDFLYKNAIIHFNH